MLAYRVKHWPLSELSPVAKSKLVSNKLVYLPKQMILDNCNEERTHMFFKNRRYAIAWAWNNIPTELEWDKKSDSCLIRIEFRVSPLIKEGYLALLSFELPSSLDFDQLLTAREEQPL
jgi:hypothetical protein